MGVGSRPIGNGMGSSRVELVSSCSLAHTRLAEPLFRTLVVRALLTSAVYISVYKGLSTRTYTSHAPETGDIPWAVVIRLHRVFHTGRASPVSIPVLFAFGHRVQLS